ncbi:phosphomevalonate kinase [Lacticaseibacillus nasuensis]|uniref:phosphomevalonate kinase n=1 Tax=Lacticaseibacillus nasuensis TaxID=944671 RepID=UPI002246AADD|nr:phosphomevalonate kinase [Lacticaseibacillus nasuensis]MCX2455468.1 phosphomevalonate kinase [Lacticaseibacillus nasuensis]
MVTAQAPGKLYIAGEYAVVETGYPAIIVALNQFVTVTVTPAKRIGSIQSKQYQENSLMWSRQGDEMVFDNRDNPFHYILSAIKLTETYARELGKPLAVYNMSIDSDLDSTDGKKFGLGSSAAVTVATVKALNAFYALGMTPDQVYKLAAIAHLDIQGNGSLGDIAASVYGGWIAYRSFDKAWLAAQRREHSLRELLAMSWPGLSIELLQAPAAMQLVIGWTGSPASTSQLVDKIAIAQARERAEYKQFLAASKATIEHIIDGFHAGALATIQAGVRRNRELLAHLAAFSGVEIETAKLHTLCELAEAAGGAAKSSGAGGGDCGIVLIDQTKAVAQLAADWAEHSIDTLALSVHEIPTQA